VGSAVLIAGLAVASRLGLFEVDPSRGAPGAGSHIEVIFAKRCHGIRPLLPRYRMAAVLGVVDKYSDRPTPVVFGGF